MIVRTPPGSPLTEPLAKIPQSGADLEQETRFSPPNHGVPGIYESGSSNCSVQLSHHKTEQLDPSRFRCLREDVPFNRFMSKVLTLGALHK